ncbi:MAG: hypothetical protein K2X27_19155 [Candidatus Obscuribacterales bacterium]|nr:hypothetical protein [Candidatus Obscuribacterales bacterium]
MNKFAKQSLLAITALSLGLGFATSANALPGAKPKGATLQDLQQSANPEIAAAEQNVNQAKAQVELANKQVNAAKALLKAAQADFKAATSRLDALKLNATAQGLVNETGMTPAKAAPVPIAAREEKKEEASSAPAPAPSSAPTPAATPVNNEESRIKTDFNNEAPATEPIQLR